MSNAASVYGCRIFTSETGLAAHIIIYNITITNVHDIDCQVKRGKLYNYNSKGKTLGDKKGK